jgi:saccharopine dehydrogenase-like NADP-dependent oxidoreductase
MRAGVAGDKNDAKAGLTLACTKHCCILKKTILVLGAGRSCTSLIDHLLARAEAGGWEVLVGDVDAALAAEKVGDHPHGESFAIHPNDPAGRDLRIAAADLVISMLPATLHAEVAAVAIAARVPMITPSYISPEMAALDREAERAGVLILNEMGLDPGLDHLCAIKMLDEIRSAGGVIRSFESYCGGLIAPDCDDNPWHYKFSWNPRNVVLAGQGGAAVFQEGARARLVPPHRVFQQPRQVEVQGRLYEGYPNRDSLSYKYLYGLDAVQTLIRGTLRGPGFCAGWDALVQLGCVRDDVQLEWAEGISWSEWLRTFVPGAGAKANLRQAVAEYTGAAPGALDLLEWLGLFDDRTGPAVFKGSPASVLQRLLEERWKLGPTDRDLVVQWHRVEFEWEGSRWERQSSLVLEGRDARFTAMSDTVGLPIALAAEIMLEGEGFGRVGVEAPMATVYHERLLPRLEALGIQFVEETRRLG